MPGGASGWPVVDATPSIMIIHQNHDYSHLPGGQPHYRHPETFENIRLAGGKRAIFELRDVNCRLVDGRLQPAPFSWSKFWREVEIFPLVTLHSYSLGPAFLCHLSSAEGLSRIPPAHESQCKQICIARRCFDASSTC